MNYSTIRDNHTNGTVGEFLKENITPEADVSIVSAYFTIYAYHLLRDQLQSIDGLRFIFGEPTFIKTMDPDKDNSRSYQIEDSSLAVSMEYRLSSGLDAECGYPGGTCRRDGLRGLLPTGHV